MDALAVILEAPRCIALRKLTLAGSVAKDGATAPLLGPSDVLVDVRWSGISTGTEKLLWTGEMPVFPGMGYPLVPGYDRWAGSWTPGPRRGAASATGSSCRARPAIPRRARCSAARRSG
jgi:hypothetical protein